MENVKEESMNIKKSVVHELNEMAETYFGRKTDKKLEKRLLDIISEVKKLKEPVETKDSLPKRNNTDRKSVKDQVLDEFSRTASVCDGRIVCERFANHFGYLGYLVNKLE